MRIEALQPVLLRMPDTYADIRLRPGEEVDLPMSLACRALRKAKGKVRAKDEWLVLWRHVAAISNNLVKTDPRQPRFLTAIEACDRAFEQGDKDAFLLAVEGVATAIRETE